jgi:putative tryptophan/tyrosine transport system substrate-binding protein
MKRREFITLGGVVGAWSITAQAQQSMPVIGFIREGSAQGNARWVGGFQKGLSESGYVEGKNAAGADRSRRFRWTAVF